MKRIFSCIALMAMLFVIGCTPEKKEETKELLLEASLSEFVADGVQTVNFSVTLDGEDVTAEAVFFQRGVTTALDGPAFRTTNAGEYVFYATHGDLQSNDVTVVATQAPEQQLEVKLTVAPAEIVADGEATATFTVTCEGTDVTRQSKIYREGSTTALESNTFATTEAGAYTFYALYSETASNTVNVTATELPEEGALELAVDVQTIVANGREEATLTVTQEGEDVTAEATFYVVEGTKETKMTGNKFSTLTAGTYEFYATKGRVTSNRVQVVAEENQATGTTIVFADGVTIASGWYDVNKRGNGQTHGDINMCWAASTANIMQWWQDGYVRAGNTLPEEALNGPGETYELAIMEAFWNDWNNQRGGHAFHGIPWYIEGINVCETFQNQAQPIRGGGYLKSIWSEAKKVMEMPYTLIADTVYDNFYTADINNYYVWGNGSGLSDDGKWLAFSDEVVKVIGYGMSSLGIQLSGGMHHAVTLWGYEIDNATGKVIKLWITDSDDQTEEPKTQEIHEYEVKVSNGKVGIVGDVYNGFLTLISLYPMVGYPQP
ncbi:MAG: IdeS/Mac family cysteine endopeptidase [Bacteroidales bacterium]|nr:IdeS/Mac family cysteine endopeptidase [Bacteroidales bacterium]